MKKLFIVANWKSYKSTSEVEKWFETISNSQLTANKEEKEIIVCAPSIFIPKVKELSVKLNLPISVGAQDVSPFGEGAYTGAVNVKQIKEFCEYTIIGHSERRKEFKEDDEMLAKKVKISLEASLFPIFCVQGADTPIPDGVKIAAYEPVWAIGSGTPDTPENAEKVIKEIKEKNKVEYVLYGGSVKGENVNGFTNMPSIDGVLVGGASLDPDSFVQIIKNS